MVLHNLKVGSRLGIGFGIVLSLMILTTAITFWSMKTVDSSTEHVVSESLPFTLLADRMVYNTVKVQQLLTYASVTRDRDVFVEADAQSMEFKSGLVKFRKMFQEGNDRELLNKINEVEMAFDTFTAAGKRMVETYVADGVEEGNVAMQEFDGTSNRLAGLIEVFQAQQVGEIKGKSAFILAASRRVTNLSILLGVVVLLIGITITFLTTRSLTSPLNAIVANIQTIGSGNLEQQLTINRDDGLGIVANEIDTFAGNLETEVIDAFMVLAAGEIRELSASSVDVAERAGKLLSVMVPNIHKAADLIQEIRAANEEQDAGADLVNLAIQRLDHVIQQNASISEEIASTVEALSSQSEQLQVIIGHFVADDHHNRVL